MVVLPLMVVVPLIVLLGEVTEAPLPALTLTLPGALTAMSPPADILTVAPEAAVKDTELSADIFNVLPYGSVKPHAAPEGNAGALLDVCTLMYIG
jgi:hypothetical protein